METRFYKRQVSFLVVKTVKCKRGISCNKIDMVLNVLIEEINNEEKQIAKNLDYMVALKN